MTSVLLNWIDGISECYAKPISYKGVYNQHYDYITKLQPQFDGLSVYSILVQEPAFTQVSGKCHDFTL